MRVWMRSCVWVYLEVVIGQEDGGEVVQGRWTCGWVGGCMRGCIGGWAECVRASRVST